MSSTLRRATPHCPVLLSPVLLALASACSGTPTAPPVDSTELGQDAGLNATDDATDADPPASDASTDAGDPDAGSPPRRDAGTTPARDAGTTGGGTVKVSCSQLPLGVCQSATIPASKEASYRSMCSGSSDPCPTADLVGCCVGDTSHYCYYAPQYTLSTAQQGCSIMNGTWSTTM